jgi:hypothetical protein
MGVEKFARRLIVAGVLLLSGCSFQATLDKMIPPARQDYYSWFAKKICTQPGAVRAVFAPDLRVSLDAAIAKLPAECPLGTATWQVASYSWRANAINGATERIEEIVIVGTGKGRWTTVDLRQQQLGDKPALIVAWRVVGSDTPPPALQYIDKFDDNVAVIRIAGPLGALLFIAMTLWIIRWQSRKHR